MSLARVSPNLSSLLSSEAMGGFSRDIGQILKGIGDTFVKIQSTFKEAF